LPRSVSTLLDQFQLPGCWVSSRRRDVCLLMLQYL
jgi:hypothetical protein